MAGRSHAYLEGKIEDVLVKVDKFIFPVDFIVLDFEADKEVPIILGRLFLAIGKTLIDVQKRDLTMRVNDQQATFNVLEAIKNPDEVEGYNFLSVVDFVVADRIDRCCSNEIIKVTTFEGFEEENVNSRLGGDSINGKVVFTSLSERFRCSTNLLCLSDCFPSIQSI